MTPRNPLTDPKAEDRFSDGELFIKITRVENRKVWYELRGAGSHPVQQIPMNCKESIAAFRKRKYEVLHAAD